MRIARKIFFVAVALLLTVSMASCDLIRQTGMKATAAAPASPKPSPTPEVTHEPAPSQSTPILTRALDSVPFSLIDGRLFIQMPTGTQDIARQQGIMAAGKSNRAETRLVLDGNGQQLVVYAQETFYYLDDLENDLDRTLKARYGDSFAYTAQAVKKSGDGFQVRCFTPEKTDTSTNAVLVKGAVARIADGTFITVAVYVTPETAKDMELCMKQADAILNTLQPGTRRIEKQTHEERLGQNSIVIQLDPGYEIIQEEGSDFSVFYLMKFVKPGEPAPSIGIYVGFHPAMQYSTRGIDESQLTTVSDRILNREAEWKTYKAYPGKDIYSAETAFYLNSQKLVMHIFIDAVNEAEFTELKKMIDTLEIKSAGG